MQINLCAQKALWKTKQEADTLQWHHLEVVLNAAHASNQKKKSKEITHLIYTEQNCQCYNAFHQHTKPKLAGGLAFITTMSEDNQTPTMIMDPDEINKTLLEYIRDHFAKAQGSLFTIDPLQCLLHCNGITPFGNQVLHGWADLWTPSIWHATWAHLKHLCNKSTDLDQCSHPLNYAELQNGIKKWPEPHNYLPLW